MNDEKSTRALVTRWRVGYPCHMLPRFARIALVVGCASVFTQCKNEKTVVKVDSTNRQPAWHFVRQAVPASEATLTGVYSLASSTSSAPVASS
jgi:hypothetical protein